jgi:hypothetical protein
VKAPLACLLVYSIGPFFLLPTATEIDSVLKTFQRMDRYNPDKTWKVTGDDVEDDSED